jgi:lipoprotein NlpI
MYGDVPEPKTAEDFEGRGFNELYEEGAYDRAIADFSVSIRLNPNSPVVHDERGFAYFAKGEAARALSDYNTAIRLDPKLGAAFYNRAIANVYVGSLARAVADLKRAIELIPRWARERTYAAVWLELVSQRVKKSSKLAQMAAEIDMTKWPGPVVQLFLGKATVETVLTKAKTPMPYAVPYQICDARFFGGAWDLRHGTIEQAMGLFRQAVAYCPKGSADLAPAKFELKAIRKDR